MYNNIKEAMDEIFSKVKFDKQLLKKLIEFKINYIYKNDEHTDFFSHGVTGVNNKIYFTNNDFHKFYTILNIDPGRVGKAIRQSKTFNHEWKLEGDEYNQITIYVAHRFLISSELSKAEQITGATEGILLFLLRSISAIITDRFIYPADPGVANLTFEKLSNKFLIKQLGSWYEVLKYRASEVVKQEGLHYQTLIDYDDDIKVRYILTDTQTHVSSLVKNIYAEHMLNSKAGERIKVRTMTNLDMEGVDSFNDQVGGIEESIRYVISNIPDKNGFINQSLIVVVTNILPTANEKLIKEVLTFISDNFYDTTQNETIKLFVQSSIRYSLNYINDNGLIKEYGKNLAGLLKKVKGAINSSRSSDPELLTLRDLGEMVVRSSLKRVNDQVVNNTRTAVILYLSMKALFKQK